MNLINGRGQLGFGLSSKNLYIDNIDIYHTWNFLDKSYNIQRAEYEKFMFYLENISSDTKVVFISTLSNEENWYTFYKRLCEDLLLKKTKNSLVVRLPCMIGKGVFSEFKKQTIEPYGVVNFLTIKEGCDFIVESLNKVGIVAP